MYLPLELWYYIINMVPFHERLITLRAVCSSWRNEIINSSKVDFTFILKERGRINIKLLFILNPERVKYLIIKDNILNAELMSKILNRYKNINKLDLINIDTFWSSFINITRHKNLIKLNLTSSGTIMNYTLFLISINCPNIKVLILKDQVAVNKNLLELILTRFNLLKILDIRGCYRIENIDINNLKNIYKEVKILY
jgi:hypothetical protein